MEEQQLKFVSFQLNRDLALQAGALAALRGVSRSELLRQAIRRELREAGTVKVVRPDGQQRESEAYRE